MLPVSLSIEDDCSSIESSSSQRQQQQQQQQRQRQQQSELMASMDDINDGLLPHNPLNCSVNTSFSKSFQTKSHDKKLSNASRRGFFPKTSPKRTVDQQSPHYNYINNSNNNNNHNDSGQEDETTPTEVMQNLSSIRGMSPPKPMSDAGAPTEIMTNRSHQQFVRPPSLSSLSKPSGHFPGIMGYQATPQNCLMDDTSSASSSEQPSPNMTSLLDLQSSSLSTNDTASSSLKQPQPQQSRLALHVLQHNQPKPFLLNPTDDASFHTASSSKRVETGVDSVSTEPNATTSQNVFQKRDHSRSTIFQKRSLSDDASSCYTQEKDPGNDTVQSVFSLDRLDFSFDSQGSPIRNQQFMTCATTESTRQPTRSKSLSASQRNHPLSNFSLTSTQVHPPSFSSTSLLGDMKDHSRESEEIESCPTSTSLLSTQVNPPSVASRDSNLGDVDHERENPANDEKRQTIPEKSTQVTESTGGYKSPRQQPQIQPRRQFGSIKDKTQTFDSGIKAKRVWKPPVQIKTKWKPPSQRASMSRDAPNKTPSAKPIVIVGAHFDTSSIDDEKKSDGGSHCIIQDDDDDTASAKSLREVWEQGFSRGPPSKQFVFEMEDDNTYMEDDDTASVRSLREVWEQKYSRGYQPKNDDFEIEDDDTASVKSRRDDLQRRILDQEGIVIVIEGQADTNDDDDGSVKNIRKRFEIPRPKREDVNRLRSLFEPKGPAAKVAAVRSRSWKATSTPVKTPSVRSRSWKGATERSDLSLAGTRSPMEVIVKTEDKIDPLRRKAGKWDSGDGADSYLDEDELSSGTAEMMGVGRSENHLETVDIDASKDAQGVSSSAWQRRKAAYMTRGLSNSKLRNEQLQAASSPSSLQKEETNPTGPWETKPLATKIQKDSSKVLNGSRFGSQQRKSTLSMHDRLNRWSSRLQAEKEKPLELQEKPSGYAADDKEIIGEDQKSITSNEHRPYESGKFKSFKDSRKMSTSSFPKTNQTAKIKQIQKHQRPSEDSKQTQVDRRTTMGWQARSVGGGIRSENVSQTSDRDDVFRPNDDSKINANQTAVETLAPKNDTRGQSIDTEYSDAVTLDVSIAEVSNITDPTCIQSKASRDIHSQTSSSSSEIELAANKSEAPSSHPSEACAPLTAAEMRLNPMSDEMSRDSKVRSSSHSQLATQENQLQAENKTVHGGNDSKAGFPRGINKSDISSPINLAASEDPFPSLEWANFDDENVWTKSVPFEKRHLAESTFDRPIQHTSPSIGLPTTLNPSQDPRTPPRQRIVPAPRRGASASKSNSELPVWNQHRFDIDSEANNPTKKFHNHTDFVAEVDGDHLQSSSQEVKRVTFDMAGTPPLQAEPQLADTSTPSEVSALPPVPSPLDLGYDAVMESRHKMLLSRQRAHKERVTARESVRQLEYLNQRLDPLHVESPEHSNTSKKSAASWNKVSPRSTFFGRTHPNRSPGHQSVGAVRSGQKKASSRSIFSGGRTYPKKQNSQNLGNETENSMVQNQSSVPPADAHTSNRSPQLSSLPNSPPKAIRSPLRAKIPLYHPRSHKSPAQPQEQTRRAPPSFYSRVATTMGFGETSPNQSLVDRLKAYQSSKESEIKYAGARASVPIRNHDATYENKRNQSSQGWGIVNAASDAEDSSSMASF
jgi:hypothetical protein